MAMAEQERAAGRPGGALGGGGVQQDAAAVSMQARPDPGGAQGTAEPAGGRIAAGYDVLEDLDRMIADKNDDACRARIDAWIRYDATARRKKNVKERMEERTDYTRKNRTADLVRAFIGPPVSLSRPGAAQ